MLQECLGVAKTMEAFVESNVGADCVQEYLTFDENTHLNKKVTYERNH